MGNAAQVASEVLVAGEEDVCRLCFSAAIPISRDQKHPNQVDSESLMLRLEEISWQDLTVNGFSVQRRHLYSRALALAEAARRDAARAAKGLDAKFQLAGVLIAKCAAVTEIADPEGKQVFRVIATSTEEHPAHAEIRIADHVKKQDFLKFRQALRSVLGKMQDSALLDAAG